MKRINRFLLLGLILRITGIVLVGLYASWWVAFGVFFVVAGNNLQTNAKKLEVTRLTARLFENGKASTVNWVWVVLFSALLFAFYGIGSVLL